MVVLLLLIYYYLLLLPLFVLVLCFARVLFFSNLCHSSFAIIVMGKRDLVVFWCLVTASVLWRFLTVTWCLLMVPWVSLQCAIVVFPDPTYLLFSVVGYFASYVCVLVCFQNGI